MHMTVSLQELYILPLINPISETVDKTNTRFWILRNLLSSCIRVYLEFSKFSNYTNFTEITIYDNSTMHKNIRR